MLQVSDIFPFVLLHPACNVDGDVPERMRRTWVKRALIYFAVRKDGTINLPSLYFLALATIILSSILVVYYMLVLTDGFPRLGKHYNTTCLIKDFFSILLLRSVSSWYMMRHDSHHHIQTSEEFRPGVFTSLRHFLYTKVLRWAEPPAHRWFSTFIGDHLLLFIVGLDYVQACWLVVFLYWEVWPSDPTLVSVTYILVKRTLLIVEAIQSTYLATLLMGFLYCTLEHTSRFRPGHERAAHWHLICFLVLWIPQFLVWYRVHEDLEKLHSESLHQAFEMLGAGPQIFTSHSAAMLGAILLGHHQHFQPCQDISFKSCGYVTACTVCGWLFFFVREGQHVPHPSRTVMPYVSSVCELLVSVICLIWIKVHGKHAIDRSSADAWGVGGPDSFRAPVRTDTRESMIQIIRQGSMPLADEEEQAWAHIRMAALSFSSSAVEDEEHDQGDVVFMDYDSVLVMLTLVVSSLLPLARIFGHYDARELASWFAQVLKGVVFPFSLSFFVLVVWLHNPRKSLLLKGGLWLGFIASCCSITNKSGVESCIITSAHVGSPTECCFFPGLWDFNQRILIDRQDITLYEACNKSHGHHHGHHGDDDDDDHDHDKEEDGPHSSAGERLLGDQSPHQPGRHTPDFRKYRWIEDHSAAFVFFQTLGAVGQVEFFFTMTGLFLKLILRLPLAPKRQREVELSCVDEAPVERTDSWPPRSLLQNRTVPGLAMH